MPLLPSCSSPPLTLPAYPQTILLPQQHGLSLLLSHTAFTTSSQDYTYSVTCETLRCYQFGAELNQIMQNTRQDESQAGIKVIGRNINNLRYADDTTLMAESEKELKSLLIKVEEKSGKN